MSRRDEPVTPAAVRRSAELTVNQHAPGGNRWHPGTCWQCTPDGCPQLDWALAVLADTPGTHPVPEHPARPTPGVVPRQR